MDAVRSTIREAIAYSVASGEVGRVVVVRGSGWQDCLPWDNDHGWMSLSDAVEPLATEGVDGCSVFTAVGTTISGDDWVLLVIEVPAAVVSGVASVVVIL